MNSMPHIVIIQCGIKKRETIARAEDLYIGPIFKVARETARRISSRWYIVSGVHGLVRPDTLIAPYDLKLLAPSEQWGRQVLARFLKFEPEPCKVIALCADDYCCVWADELKAERPLAHLRFPDRMKRMKAMRREE